MQDRRIRRIIVESLLLTLAACVVIFWPRQIERAKPTKNVKSSVTVLKSSQADVLLRAEIVKPKADSYHPPHTVKVWTTTHKGRIFRVVQLPRCEHMEMLITYQPSGETLAQAKKRLGGVAACTGSFHHPRTMALADFLQRNGAVLADSRTDRCVVTDHDGGKLDILRDCSQIKGMPGVSALKLGQRLVPFHRDGFSTAFMNRVTDRMAIGLNSHFIFIVQGKSDIWRLAHFFKTKLPVSTAVNSDGGHVVRGKAPVHLVFRWKKPGPVKTDFRISKSQPE